MPSKLTAYPDPTLLPHLWAWLSGRLQHRRLVWRAGGCCTVSGQTVLGWFQGEHENVMRMRLKRNTENRRRMLLFGMGCTGPLVLCWSWSPRWLRGPERADDLNIFHVLVQNKPQRYFRATLDCSCVILEDVLVHFCVSISIKEQQKQTFLSLYWTQIHHLAPPITSDHCFRPLLRASSKHLDSAEHYHLQDSDVNFGPMLKFKAIRPGEIFPGGSGGFSRVFWRSKLEMCAAFIVWKNLRGRQIGTSWRVWCYYNDWIKSTLMVTLITHSPIKHTHPLYTHVLRPSELMVLLSLPFNLMSN